MKKIYVFIVVAAIAGFVSSCYKDEPDYDVSITFIEPEAGATFSSGDTVHMEIDFEGTQVIKNIQVLAINVTSGDTLADYSEGTDEDFLYFHEHFLPIVAVTSNFKVVASAWESDYANRITNEVDITVNP